MRCLTFAVSALTLTAPLGWADASRKDADAAALVRQLGGESFAEREAAGEKLLASGAPAKRALQAGVANSDPEIMRRSQAILTKIRDGERDAFLAGKLDWPGPVGRKFREVVGNGDAARKLFGAVLKVGACCDVLERLADAPDEAPVAYAAELARLEKAGKSVLGGQNLPADMAHACALQEGRRCVRPGDVVLALLLEGFRKPEDTRKPLRTYELLSISFMDLARGPLREPFCKLFLAWLDRQTEDGDLVNGLDAALYAPIPEAVPVARRALKEPKVGTGTVGRSLHLLGHHGEVEDLARIGTFRDNVSSYQGYVGPKGEMWEVQLRDIAAAMALKLRRQNPADYGFPTKRDFTWWSEPAFYETPLSFRTTEARDAAHRKTWAWLDEQGKGPKK